jgi:hypothetical protein
LSSDAGAWRSRVRSITHLEDSSPVDREQVMNQMPLPRRAARFLQRCPWVVPVLLVPAWISWFLVDRDVEDTGHPLFYHIPDITQDPLALLLNLTITPLVNTQFDQIILITVLIGTFGVLVERRLGALTALALFWGTSAAGALGGGLLLHVLYPLFPEVHAFSDGGWYRVFNGASAGGFGFMGAYAAMARWPLLWIGLFFVWEPGFWLLVSGDFTSAFHILAFTTGFVTVRYFLYDRAMRNAPS